VGIEPTTRGLKVAARGVRRCRLMLFALVTAARDASSHRELRLSDAQSATTTRPHGAPTTPSREDVIAEAGRKYAAPCARQAAEEAHRPGG
jgi:hypothetical protein